VNNFDCVAIADNQAVLDQSNVIFLGLTVGAAPEILEPRIKRGF